MAYHWRCGSSVLRHKFSNDCVTFQRRKQIFKREVFYTIDLMTLALSDPGDENPVGAGPQRHGGFPMLILTRRMGEVLRIGEDVSVTVVGIKGIRSA